MANEKAAIGVLASQPRALADSKPAAFISHWDEVEDPLDSPDVEGEPLQERRSNRVMRMDARYEEIKDDFDIAYVNSVGEGQIRVCGEAGNFEAGDLIVCSSIPGKGMKQADDIVRSITVAKIREEVVFSSPTEIKMVACVYLCG